MQFAVPDVSAHLKSNIGYRIDSIKTNVNVPLNRPYICLNVFCGLETVKK